MSRARVPLTFGAGLDRTTGAGVRDGRSLYDARNVTAREASLALRQGLGGTGLPVLTWGTDVLEQRSVELTRDLLQVIYDRTTREIRLFRVNPVNPPTRQQVASWGTLNENASFPVITMAEAGGVVYMAHAEPILSYRLPSKYWAPGALDTDAGTLTTASADLDGDDTPGDIAFYAVAAYRNYIVGCGWGTETNAVTADRPETVRLTKPDDPTVWPPELYFLAGTKSNRVEACFAINGGLLCASRTQRHTIYGLDPSTFGIDLTDSNAGVVSPRAWAVVDGIAYTWATTGPRVNRDPMGPSEDVAIPLDLMAPQPTGLPSRGPEREAFAGYEPEQRVIYWAWPDLTAESAPQTLVYTQSLRSEAARFTLAVFERRVSCAGRYLSGKVILPPNAAYASAVSSSDAPWVSGTTGRPVTISWTNNLFFGNETVEVWRREITNTGDYGAWSLVTSVAVSTVTQSVTLNGQKALIHYEYILRLRSPSGAYADGYEGDDPELWTAVTAADAKCFESTSAAAPTITGTAWSRISASATRVRVTGAHVDAGVDIALEKLTGGSWSEVAVAAVGANSGNYTVDYVLSESDVIGTSISFRTRLRRQYRHPDTDAVSFSSASGYSSTAVATTGVLETPPVLDFVFDASTPAQRAVEVWDLTNGALQDAVSGGGSGRVIQFEEVGVGSIVPVEVSYPLTNVALRLPSATATDGTMTIRARVGIIAFGVTDYGPWGDNYARTCALAGTAPPAPDVAQFFDPNGSFDLVGDIFNRFLPRAATPSELTTADRRLSMLVEASTQIAMLETFDPSDNGNLVIFGDNPFNTPYNYAFAFHFDVGTWRRSSFTDAHP